MTVMITNTNTTNIAKAIVNIVSSEEEGKSGSFALIQKYRNEMETLTSKLSHGANAGLSRRGIILDFFGAQPEGEKLIEQAASFKGKGKSKNDRIKQAALDARIKSVIALLERTAVVMDVIQRLEAADFEIRYKTTGTARIVALVHGVDDDQDDAKPMSVENMRAIAGNNFTNIRKVTDLGGKRSKAPNKDKGGQERIAPAKLRDVVNSLDTTLSAFDIAERDCGLPTGAVMSIALLWARLDAELTDEQKNKARMEFEAEGDEPEFGVSQNKVA